MNKRAVQAEYALKNIPTDVRDLLTTKSKLIEFQAILELTENALEQERWLVNKYDTIIKRQRTVLREYIKFKKTFRYFRKFLVSANQLGEG